MCRVGRPGQRLLDASSLATLWSGGSSTTLSVSQSTIRFCDTLPAHGGKQVKTSRVLRMPFLSGHLGRRYARV
jgi:hypothetical protein